MTRHLLTSAVIAGGVAGLCAALLSLWLVVPSLLEGELYESGARVHFATNGTPQSERGAPSLLEPGRHGMTVGFAVISHIGFGLILAGLMTLAGRVSGARAGVIWGLAGFVAVQLAPAIGLPPELPGTPAAEIGPRQTWWLATILVTALGLWLIAFRPGFQALAGVPPIAAPHLIGAPHLDQYWGVAPPELAAHFVSLSLGVAAAGWAILGAVLGYLMARETG